MINDPAEDIVAAGHHRIYDLQISGHTALPFNYIYDQLQISPGDTLNLSFLQKRIAALKITGYFENVDFRIVPVTEKDVEVIIQVKENEFPLFGSDEGEEMMAALKKKAISVGADAIVLTDFSTEITTETEVDSEGRTSIDTEAKDVITALAIAWK